MAFDQRSLKRLEELGRTLPAPLPLPPPQPKPDRPALGRHPLETETDPEKLFQQLMQASSDGSVPPHLLERLKALESQKRAVKGEQRQRPPARQGDAQYVVFEQLLLEDDSEP